jgi:hypothetical protein
MYLAGVVLAQGLFWLRYLDVLDTCFSSLALKMYQSSLGEKKRFRNKIFFVCKKKVTTERSEKKNQQRKK